MTQQSNTSLSVSLCHKADYRLLGNGMALQLGSTACAKLFPRLPFTTVYHNRCIKTVLSELPIPLMANLQEEDVAAINPLFQYVRLLRPSRLNDE
jgi:hypothetical protein